MKTRMAELRDGKTDNCLAFILRNFKAHLEQHEHDCSPPAFVIGLNGVQGAGKSSLVSSLQMTLSSPPYSLPTVALSLDDIYLPHTAQKALAARFPENPLLQHRGQPSTHDIALGRSVLHALKTSLQVSIPRYDKSAFGGEGDRVEKAQCDLSPKDVKVVIFEGWCVGFRPLPQDVMRRLWESAVRRSREQSEYNGRLGFVKWEDIVVINEALRNYNALNLDTEDLRYVYDWRLEQEDALRAEKGVGMTFDEVNNFVDAYYPSYELYTHALRNEILIEGKQMRLVLEKSRRVKEMIYC